MSLIKAVAISKIYQNGGEKNRVLNNVSLQVEEGDLIALVGPSGSGKSTLLTIIGALNAPNQGNLYIDDIDVYALKPENRADFRSSYLGFVFQQFHLIPYLNAMENVMLPLAILNYSHGEQKEKAQEVLEKVGLGSKLKRLPNQLSGGEQERVAIARAIVNQPPIILADEPTGALDTTTGREIMGLFKELNKEGLTIVMVTHNPEMLHYVNRTITIRDGIIEKTTTKGER